MSIYKSSLDQYAFVDEHTHNSDYPNDFITRRHVDQLFKVRYKDYNMYQEDKCTNTIANYIVKGIHEKNTLTQVFFSKENLDHLQSLIIKLVYDRSYGKWRITRQSDNELLIIMRSIYLQYAKHLPYDIKGQIAELNKQVILDTVPRIMVKVEQHLGYQRDQGSTLRPIPRGELASAAGTKTTKGFSSVFI